MGVSIAICAVTGALVFLSVLFKPYFMIGKIKIGTYWVISLVGAIFLVALKTLPFDYLLKEINSNSAMNPIKILVLFFSMTALSVFLDEIGLFKYLASVVLKKTGTSQIKLFVLLYAVVSVLTIFTSNDIVVLTFTPFICFFAKNAKINPTPYLFAEFVGANTWSMLFIIGNPTNVYLASSAGIDFMAYLAKMALPTFFGGIVSFSLLLLLFRKDLKEPISATGEVDKIKDKFSLWLGVAHLGACTILLAISAYIKLEMHLISAVFALSLLLISTIALGVRKKSFKPLVSTLKRLPFELAPFLIAMFTLVLSLNYNGVTEKIADLMFKGEPIFTVGISSFIVSNIINNIPMSVLYSSLIEIGANSASFAPSLYSAIIGSNIGACFTQVGALAGIMWATILKRFKVDFSFKKFVLYGALISLPTLMASLLGLLIIF